MGRLEHLRIFDSNEEGRRRRRRRTRRIRIGGWGSESLMNLPTGKSCFVFVSRVHAYNVVREFSLGGKACTTPVSSSCSCYCSAAQSAVSLVPCSMPVTRVLSPVSRVLCSCCCSAAQKSVLASQNLVGRLELLRIFE